MSACVQNRPYAKTWLELWQRPAPTYCLPDTNNKWGSLKDPREYFYCQKNTDKKVQVGQYWNTWWALTDDDSGHVGERRLHQGRRERAGAPQPPEVLTTF